MKKQLLFLMMLFPIATAFMSGSVYADDPDKLQYDAAMDAITDGNYYLLTRVNGIKYYVTPEHYEEVMKK